MSDDTATADPGPVAPPVEQQTRSAAWEMMHAQHAEAIAEREPITWEVPGRPGVWIRFKYVPLLSMEKSAVKIAKLSGMLHKQSSAAADLLRDACEEFMIANPTDPRADETGLAPLCDPGEEPIKFDRVLARAMEWEDEHLLSASQIVRRYFGDDKGDRRMIAFAAKVDAWMDDERPRVEEEFAGK